MKFGHLMTLRRADGQVYLTLPSGTTVLDEDDVPVLGGFTWWAQQGRNTTYIRGEALKGTRSTGRRVYLHRLILGVTDTAIVVDHRNGDGLDNRRANLRLATASQNGANTERRGGKYSQLKGVSYNRRARRWFAQISCGGVYTHLGYFASEIEAARAYDAAALLVFGEFARTNGMPA